MADPPGTKGDGLDVYKRQADCTAGREHDEAEAASELFTFHCSNSPFDKLRSRYSWSLFQTRSSEYGSWVSDGRKNIRLS